MSDVSWIPRIGDEFAGYRLVSLLGHGGMSIVYRAEHIGLERTVALKLLSPQLSDDEDFRERFQRESKVAASLEHPNIIPIYEAGGENGVFYIAMRYVDGADLKTRLKESGQLEAQQVVSFVAQVAAALEAAHARGLIHRDVKPANILIAPGAGVEGSDHVYLSDFGVAKNTGAAGLTKTGLFVGTAEYASPEQIEGKELDGRADIYSLGCVTYEALTGAPTYEKESEVAMMYAHLLEPPPKLSERRPDLGFPVDEVIAKAVAKSRDDRYARPSEFALALRQAVGANAPVGPETILAGSALAAPALRPLRPLRPRSRPSRSRRRRSQSRRRNRQPRRPQGLRTAASSSSAAAFSRSSSQPASSFLCWRSPVGSPRHPRRLRPGRRAPLRQARRPSRPRRRACCQSWRRRRSRRSAQRKARRPTGQWRPSSACRRRPIRHPCPTRSDSRSIPGHRPSSAHTGGSTPGLAVPATRWSNADPLRRANVPGSTRPGSGAVGSSATRMRKGNFVIVWTHEKLGSTDHVDMLGTATEPGRAPTIVGGWWNSLNDSIGKCRPKVSEELCLATIARITGTP